MFFGRKCGSEIRLERRKIHYYLRRDILRAVGKKLKLNHHQPTEIILCKASIYQEMTVTCKYTPGNKELKKYLGELISTRTNQFHLPNLLMFKGLFREDKKNFQNVTGINVYAL